MSRRIKKLRKRSRQDQVLKLSLRWRSVLHHIQGYELQVQVAHMDRRFMSATYPDTVDSTGLYFSSCNVPEMQDSQMYLWGDRISDRSKIVSLHFADRQDLSAYVQALRDTANLWAKKWPGWEVRSNRPNYKLSASELAFTEEWNRINV